MKFEAPFLPPGYLLLRPLSTRAGSWVYLATTPAGTSCALKLQQVARTTSLATLSGHRATLQILSREPGFVPIVAWGVDEATGVLWEELALADDLLGRTPLDADYQDTYTPLSLVTWLGENRSATTPAAVRWGIRLAEALTKLHDTGLLHRDVKPANILFLHGEPCLADYGSVGEQGSPVEFPGTEGYVPPDGLGSPAMDVFALGRTLYEAWTGFDRFRFPSLPPALRTSPDWPTHGWLLNRALLHAADGRPSHRFSTAAELVKHLRHAQGGAKAVSRRRLLQGAAAGVGALGVFYVWRNRPSHRAVWRRLPPPRFGYEHWHGSGLTCDWDKRMIYSLTTDPRGAMLQWYDLKSWKHEERLFPDGPKRAFTALLNPETKTIWGYEMVSGSVWEGNPEGLTLTSKNATPLDELDFSGPIYWNPETKRIGSFGGYGGFRNHNRRREFQASDQKWVALQDQSSAPWPRSEHLLFPDQDNQRWFTFGGMGNATGKQSDEVKGLKGYDGRFYPLNDLWELDLAANKWRQLLPVQRWNPVNLKAAICHPGLNALLFLTGSAPGREATAAFHLLSLSHPTIPRELPSVGDTIKMYQYWTVLVEPESQALWVFADEGVFAVTIEAA